MCLYPVNPRHLTQIVQLIRIECNALICLVSIIYRASLRLLSWLLSSSKSKTDRWWSFAASVLPAPVIGSIVGGPALSSKCILIAALAACQSAYFLALAEGVLARATDAVALKARSAAVCDT